MKDIEGTAYTLIAYSKALRCKVRLVIWQMPNGKKKLFFSTDTSLSGEEVLLYYRTRFQIEFCFRDAKGYTGLMDCQARDKWKLDFAFNASFTSLNVAKVTMKEMGMEYSMSSFKSLMTNIYLVKRIFKASGYTPNRTLISKIFKDLSCLQRIAAQHIIELLTNYCCYKSTHNPIHLPSNIIQRSELSYNSPLFHSYSFLYEKKKAIPSTRRCQSKNTLILADYTLYFDHSPLFFDFYPFFVFHITFSLSFCFAF